MIITVTMNPAIDKTIDIDRLERGGLNRIKHVELDAGGKGINVSKTIYELGGKSIATGFVAGNAGKIIENVMNQLGIQTDFVQVEGETRTNTKVFEEAGDLTELNEPGPEIKKADIQKLFKKLDDYASKDTLFVLAGSIPKGIDTDIYYKIIKSVHEKGAKVLLDADGELCTKALEAGPDIIKPNRVELEQYAGLNYVAEEQELVVVAEKLFDKGISDIAISMGKCGAIFLGKDYRFRCPGLHVKAHSTVGAGDAMVAALSYAADQELSREETAMLCMAVSAGAVTTIGTKPPCLGLVEQLKKQVTIETIS